MYYLLWTPLSTVPLDALHRNGCDASIRLHFVVLIFLGILVEIDLGPHHLARCKRCHLCGVALQAMRQREAADVELFVLPMVLVAAVRGSKYAFMNEHLRTMSIL